MELEDAEKLSKLINSHDTLLNYFTESNKLNDVFTLEVLKITESNKTDALAYYNSIVKHLTKTIKLAESVQLTLIKISGVKL